MRKTTISLSLIAATAVACPWHFLSAQETEEDSAASAELEIIDLGQERQAPHSPNEGVEGIKFDEATQSYRLVIDDSGDDYGAPLSERETQLNELQRLFELYSEALDNEDYLEADTLAKRVVELSIRLNGLDSHDSAKAITNLGIAQHKNRDYASALRNFMASIDIVERIDDNLSPGLINPLQGLAATHAAVGRPDLARLAYQRAVHVSHVNEGPHNPDQVDILTSMSELHISQRDWDEALDIQERVFSIQARNIDPLSLEMIPPLERRANWQNRLQQYTRERVTWRQIINILERHHGKKSLELLPPLTSLGNSFLFVSPTEYDYQPGVSASSGESYMRRAYRIASEHPDANWETVELSMLSLADYYVLSGRANRAATVYEDTWEYLTEGDDPDRLRARRDDLETIKVLQKTLPPRYYNSELRDDGRPPPDEFEQGVMSFIYVVSPSGRVVNVKHLETQPGQVINFDKVVGRALRRQIYRPRMKDGVVVATGDVVYTHEFYYREDDLPSMPAAEAEPSADDGNSPGDAAE
ncbi:MAG: tetratricopeptide repeat protein [Woeseiaceae bacterium]|nr:tetratricopeptide repeat protein [Woeseiaceae bacterium]